MNINLITLEDAKAVAVKLHDALGPFGVLPVELYIPEFGFVPAPEEGDGKYYFMVLSIPNTNNQNVMIEGFNVGLINAFINMFPFRWQLMLMTEFNRSAQASTLIEPAPHANVTTLSFG